MLSYETSLFKKGLELVAGTDEAGRGPLAGPIVAASVILDKNAIIELHERLINNDVLNGDYNTYSLIKDSKQLSEKSRVELADFIKKVAIDYSTYLLDNKKVDEFGITRSNQIVLFYSFKGLRSIPQHILTDHFELSGVNQSFQTNLTKGETKSISIAAASILAKVYRDDLMYEYHNMYSNYGFNKHKGYGTKMHVGAIRKYGPCAIHRTSFEPVKSYLTSKEFKQE